MSCVIVYSQIQSFSENIFSHYQFESFVCDWVCARPEVTAVTPSPNVVTACCKAEPQPRCKLRLCENTPRLRCREPSSPRRSTLTNTSLQSSLTKVFAMHNRVRTVGSGSERRGTCREQRGKIGTLAEEEDGAGRLSPKAYIATNEREIEGARAVSELAANHCFTLVIRRRNASRTTINLFPTKAKAFSFFCPDYIEVPSLLSGGGSPVGFYGCILSFLPFQWESVTV